MKVKRLLPLILFRGVLGALLFVAFFLLLYSLSSNPFLPSVKSYDFFIYAFWLFIILAHYRFRLKGGKMTFGEGFTLALGTSILMISMSVLFLFTFLQSVDPELSTNYGEYEIAQFEGAKKQWIEEFDRSGKDGPQIYQQTLANYQKRDWNTYLIQQEIWQKGFITFFMSIILPLILRRS